MPSINVNQTNASETAKGIVEEATQAEVNAGTDTGGTGAKVFVAPSKLQSALSGYVASGGAAGGELSGTYPNPSLVNGAVITKVLTGFSVGANSTISATDSVAGAFAKTQGQINARPNETATSIATIINAVAAKTTPVDADELTGTDSASSQALTRFTWANIKATLKTYFDSLTTTLTNKRITARVQSVASAATVTPNADSDDEVIITAQAVGLTLANPSGTPTEGQALIIRIKDNGTARSIAYGSEYRAIGVTLPTTTVISKTLYLGLIRNHTDTKWDCIGVSQEA